ncbi:hypothetical protein B0T13DRAFT_106493 [Neurospora crassa]|nr:hypothetical protein B0T13DRAFT_106493 [Neurospora crassa]
MVQRRNAPEDCRTGTQQTVTMRGSTRHSSIFRSIVTPNPRSGIPSLQQLQLSTSSLLSPTALPHYQLLHASVHSEYPYTRAVTSHHQFQQQSRRNSALLAHTSPLHSSSNPATNPGKLHTRTTTLSALHCTQTQSRFQVYATRSPRAPISPASCVPVTQRQPATLQLPTRREVPYDKQTGIACRLSLVAVHRSTVIRLGNRDALGTNQSLFPFPSWSIRPLALESCLKLVHSPSLRLGPPLEKAQ